jgi:hypothetical protein
VKIVIKEEKNSEIKRITEQFKGKLSERKIRQKTGAAMNETMRRAATAKSKQLTLEKYNLKKKNLKDITQISPKAYYGKLESGLKISSLPISMIDYTPTWNRGGSALSIQIIKGKTTVVRSAFIATMKSGHKGVFARGYYPGKGRGFVFENDQSRIGKGRVRNDFGEIIGGEKTGHIRITELRGPSPFSVATNKDIGNKVRRAMGEDLLKRVEGLLRKTINEMAK